MALSREQIAAEVAAKGYTLVDASGYKNMTSNIVVRCPKGHEFTTNINAVRHPSFECPVCRSANFQVIEKPKTVPQKKGFRIIAFDQATYKMGMSIWEDGKLVYWDLFQFSDNDLVDRLLKIKRLLNEVVIPLWQPDYLVFEDIQEQHGGVVTFKILAMLLGICVTTAKEHNIEYTTVAPVVWRKTFASVSGGRAAEKSWAVKKVHELTGQIINEDTSEAILIGYSVAQKVKQKPLF